jgi:hypothetical protein
MNTKKIATATRPTVVTLRKPAISSNLPTTYPDTDVLREDGNGRSKPRQQSRKKEVQPIKRMQALKKRCGVWRSE